MEEKKRADDNAQVVTSQAKSSFSDLWRIEDYWAIWLGFLLVIFGAVLYFPRGPANMKQTIAQANAILEAESQRAPFKSIAWYQAVDAKKRLKATSSPLGKEIKSFTSKPKKWAANPLYAFFMGEEAAGTARKKAMAKYEVARKKGAAALERAKAAEEAASAAGFLDDSLNAAAVKAIDVWHAAHTKASKAKSVINVHSYSLILSLICLMIVLAIFFGMGQKVMGHSIISNTVGTPKWVMPAVQTEYYIKTGLVLLGAEILFGKILLIGVPGIFVAWVVTPTVLICTYIFGQKIVKMPSKTLNITISADMSVCGVSAAIATAAACRAKKEELTLAVGFSLVFTSIMMIAMPAIIKLVGMPYILGGAWMGGTIDSTGAVAAAGAFLSKRALYVAATIKMIQNVLIGVIAFGVAIYWCARVECVPGQRVSAMEIWHRFPKFVLGFMTASIVSSLVYQHLGNDVAYVLIDQGAIGGMSKIFRGWFFCLAFVSIGLATNFRELKEYFKGGKPLILYVCGQSFNLILTLIMAYIMFYLVFPEITARI